MTGKLHSYDMYVKKDNKFALCLFLFLFINVCELYIYLLEILEYFILVGNGVIMSIFR